MATRPNRTTYPPEWCTTGTATDPGSALRASGWLPLMPLPAAAANFLWKCLGIWTDYFDDDIQDGRIPTTGYKYGAAVSEHLLDLTPPGTYQELNAGALTYVSGGTPPYLSPALAGAIFLPAMFPLRFSENVTIGTSYITISAVGCYAKGGATSSARLRLMSLARTGAAAFVTEHTYDFTADFPSAFAEFTEVTSIAVDPAKSYYLWAEMKDTVTAADVAVASVWVVVEKTRVE